MAKTGPRLSADRITISLGHGQRDALEEIAQRNGATLSFVVRRALEDLIARNQDRQLPLDFTVSPQVPSREDGGRG